MILISSRRAFRKNNLKGGEKEIKIVKDELDLRHGRPGGGGGKRDN